MPLQWRSWFVLQYLGRCTEINRKHWNQYHSNNGHNEEWYYPQREQLLIFHLLGAGPTHLAAISTMHTGRFMHVHAIIVLCRHVHCDQLYGFIHAQQACTLNDWLGKLSINQSSYTNIHYKCCKLQVHSSSVSNTQLRMLLSLDQFTVCLQQLCLALPSTETSASFTFISPWLKFQENYWPASSDTMGYPCILGSSHVILLEWRGRTISNTMVIWCSWGQSISIGHQEHNGSQWSRHGIAAAHWLTELNRHVRPGQLKWKLWMAQPGNIPAEVEIAYSRF